MARGSGGLEGRVVSPPYCALTKALVSHMATWPWADAMLGLVDGQGLRGPRNIRADSARFQAPLGGRDRRFLPITAPGGRCREDDFGLFQIARQAVDTQDTASEE